jgi:cytoskeletal protein CcmA (bactofilin family)
MALSFGRKSDGMEPTTGSPAPLAPAPPQEIGAPAGLTAYIDQGSEFEGKLSFKDTVRIDGRFLGEIASENTLVVGETGEIMAQIRSQTVIVSGTVTGNITATRKLVLHKTARVEGDVETSSLVIEDGGVLNGRIAMKPAPKPAAKVEKTEAKPAAPAPSPAAKPN